MYNVPLYWCIIHVYMYIVCIYIVHCMYIAHVQYAYTLMLHCTFIIIYFFICRSINRHALKTPPLIPLQHRYCMHIVLTRDEMRRKKKASKVKQTTLKAKQHSTPKAVTFPNKNELPWVGLEPTTLYTLDRALYH